MYTALIQYDNARRKRTAEQDWQPSIADLGLMDEFRTLVEASNNASVTTASFSDLLPGTMQSWKLARQSEFVKMMVAAVPSLASHPTPLKLAIALFDCTKCSRRELRWPHILAHQCPRVQQSFYCDPYRVMLEEVRRLHSQPHSWITEGSFTFARSEEVEDIQSAISACGLHWSAATHDEMEEMRLACRICRKSSRDSCIVLDWRRLVSFSFRLIMSMRIRARSWYASRNCTQTVYWEIHTTNQLGNPFMVNITVELEETRPSRKKATMRQRRNMGVVAVIMLGPRTRSAFTTPRKSLLSSCV